MRFEMEERIQKEILKHLGYPPEVVPDRSVAAQVENAWRSLEEISNFRYLYAEFSVIPEFLQAAGYHEYLSDTNRILLCATTLGNEVDKHLRRLELTDMASAVVFDTTAGVYLEMLADTYEAALPYPELGFRFCPGYGGTPLSDSRNIAETLHAEKIGITFLDSGMMVPSKSMTGVLRIGGIKPKSCTNCANFSHCSYRMRGTTCYKNK